MDDQKIPMDGDLAENGDEEAVHAAKFERIRRITGYLVGDLKRFNDAKREEVLDRVKHGVGSADSAINCFKGK